MLSSPSVLYPFTSPKKTAPSFSIKQDKPPKVWGNKQYCSVRGGLLVNARSNTS